MGVTVSLRGVVTVLVPGTGSDDDYLRRSLGGPLEPTGAQVIAVPPDPYRLVAGFVEAMDRAAQTAGRIAVGGISLGAVLAARWAVANPDRTVAVIAVLPPWTGAPDDAPAAVSARHTAAALRRDGLVATTAAMRSSSPDWLADELARSWERQWPALPDAMEQAAACVAPRSDQLRALTTPLAVVAAPDDLVHPIAVAADWAAWAPHAAMAEVSLADFGPDPTRLGAACVAALNAIERD